MTDIPPKWAMEKARGIVAKRCPTTSLSDLVIKGAFDNAEPDIRDIARALAAEREAATMAERERWLGWVDAYTDKPLGKAEGWTEEQGEFFKTGQLDLAAALAAAIRAGE